MLSVRHSQVVLQLFRNLPLVVKDACVHDIHSRTAQRLSTSVLGPGPPLQWTGQLTAIFNRLVAQDEPTKAAQVTLH